jgi:hypothetical protein
MTSLSVSSGSSAGGTAVTITRTNKSAATGVFFGGVAATSFYVISSTGIQALALPQAAEAGNLYKYAEVAHVPLVVLCLQ